MAREHIAMYVFDDSKLFGYYRTDPKHAVISDPLKSIAFPHISKKPLKERRENGYCTQMSIGGFSSLRHHSVSIKKEKRKVVVSDPVSMTKFMFDNHRLDMYTFLNKLRKNGKLSGIVGARVRNGVLDSEVVEFPRVRYWRYSRESFIADVEVELLLDTDIGPLLWKGILVLYCGFTEGFYVDFEELTAHVDRNEYDPLDRFLVPVIRNRRIDECAEHLWKQNFPESQYYDDETRSAVALAERMGLKVEYYDVCNSQSIKGILFFAEGELKILPKVYEYDENGVRYSVDNVDPVNVKISGGTIVINTSVINPDYSGFYILHECMHNEFHYLFYRLQQMCSNDPRKMKTKEVEVEGDEEEKDVMSFIENQANRGAYGLLMPYIQTMRLIDYELSSVKGFRHDGEKYDQIIKNISMRIRQPHFLVRNRMVQLGYIKAKGSSQTVNGEVVPPFDFDIDSWRDSRHTYVIDEDTVSALCDANSGMRKLMQRGDYVCAEGHVVRNISRFVTEKSGKRVLTDFANAHVDDCCLRFYRIYRRGYFGKTAFDHMCFDEDYLKQTAFYLSDVKNKAQLEGETLDDFDAKRMFLKEFPLDFKEAVDKLREVNGMSLDTLAELILLDRKTLTRWLVDSKKYRNEDFLTILCLVFRLPDWLSMMLFKRAHFMFDEDDKRHASLLHILRAQSENGIDAANEYLIKNHLKPLSLEGA